MGKWEEEGNIKIYVHGFDKTKPLVPKLWTVSTGYQLFDSGENPKQVAKDATYQGQMKNDVPDGIGTLLVENCCIIKGKFIPDENIVFGYLKYTSEASSNEIYRGAFRYNLLPDEPFQFTGFASTERMMGSLTRDQFVFATEETLKPDSAVQLLKRSGECLNSKWNGTVVVRQFGKGDKRRSIMKNQVYKQWYEQWSEGVLTHVHAYKLPISIEGILSDSSLEEWNVDAEVNSYKEEETGEAVDKSGLIYKSTGVIRLRGAQGIIEGLLTPEKLILGTFERSGSSSFFTGLIHSDSLEYSEGELVIADKKEHQVGTFKSNSLEGMSKVEHKNDEISILGEFKLGRKEGLCLILHKGQPMLACTYSNDVRNGDALRYLGAARKQLLSFAHGELRVAYESD